MAKVCSNCEAILSSGPEEFGDPRAPVCRDCFLSGSEPARNEIAEKIARLKEEREGCESEISGLEDEISEIEDRVRDIKTELAKLEARAKGQSPEGEELARLTRWRNRLPIQGGTATFAGWEVTDGQV
jgi:septal ring factor EnvC (AmiA/AmiB activator)